ncbi:MAG: hypothetical protein J6S76_04440 [Clostridia bacterium]|nr:hypothetical protein [Clostridia bacterium]
MTDTKKQRHPQLIAFAIGMLLGCGMAASVLLAFYLTVFRLLFPGG